VGLLRSVAVISLTAADADDRPNNDDVDRFFIKDQDLIDFVVHIDKVDLGRVSMFMHIVII